MGRFFTRRQKLALAKAARWRCSICGTSLTDNFHADHVIPYSKGGRTDVINGQALCPTCNIKKGNKMTKKIHPRQWQRLAIKVAKKRAKKDKFCTLIQATPGGGKTIAGLLIWEHLKKKYGYTHLLIIVPTDLLRTHWVSDAHNFNINMSDEIIFKGQDKFSQFDGIVTTYATLHNQVSDFRIFCKEHRVYVIADEVHHISTKENTKWGASFKEAVSPANKLLMLTGTPWTTSGDPIPWTEGKADGYVKTHFSYSKADAIKDNVCRDSLIFPQRDVAEMFDKVTGETYSSFEDYSAKTGKDAYRAAITNKVNMMTMFRKANEQLNSLRGSGNSKAAGLLVAPDISTAHKFAEEIEATTGVSPVVVSSRDWEDKMDNSNKKKIDKFRDSSDRWIISVNMISEGIDIKRLQVLLFLSAAKTELYFRQVLGRVERRMNSLEVDRTCYVYYISHPVLDKWVEKIMSENSQGVKLRESRLSEEPEDIKEGVNNSASKNEPYTTDLQVVMEEIQAYMLQNGVSVTNSVMEEIKAIIEGNSAYSKLPQGILILMAEANIADREEGVTTTSNGLTLKEKETILRSQLKKAVGRQVGLLGWSKRPRAYSVVNYVLNEMVGIMSNAEASIDKLTAKRDLASEPSKWEAEVDRQLRGKEW